MVEAVPDPEEAPPALDAVRADALDDLDAVAEVISAAVEEIEFGITDADLGVGEVAADPFIESPVEDEVGDLVEEEDETQEPVTGRPDRASTRGGSAPVSENHGGRPTPLSTARVPEVPDVSLAVATALESVARRLRSGELLVPATSAPGTEEAAVSLVLAALLGVRS